MTIEESELKVRHLKRLSRGSRLYLFLGAIFFTKDKGLFW